MWLWRIWTHIQVDTLAHINTERTHNRWKKMYIFHYELNGGTGKNGKFGSLLFCPTYGIHHFLDKTRSILILRIAHQMSCAKGPHMTADMNRNEMRKNYSDWRGGRGVVIWTGRGRGWSFVIRAERPTKHRPRYHFKKIFPFEWPNVCHHHHKIDNIDLNLLTIRGFAPKSNNHQFHWLPSIFRMDRITRSTEIKRNSSLMLRASLSLFLHIWEMASFHRKMTAMDACGTTYI